MKNLKFTVKTKAHGAAILARLKELHYDKNNTAPKWVKSEQYFLFVYEDGSIKFLEKQYQTTYDNSHHTESTLDDLFEVVPVYEYQAAWRFGSLYTLSVTFYASIEEVPEGLNRADCYLFEPSKRLRE